MSIYQIDFQFSRISYFIFIFSICLIFGCGNEDVDTESSYTNSRSQFQAISKKSKGEPEMTGAEFYAEFHSTIRTAPGEDAPGYSTNDVYTAYRTAQKQSKAKNNILDWKERGPGNVGGRTRGLWLDPRDTDHKTIMAGSAGGGVWKSTDGGNTWNLITPELTSMATTTIAGCMTQPDVLYVGTGEGFTRLSISGNGIWKSIDGGQTWSQLASTINANFSNITRMVVDPDNPDIVIAATRANFNTATDPNGIISSIFKSLDGGTSWTSVFSEKLSTNGGIRANNVEQIVADPTDFNILYASVNSKGIYKSEDKGDTWKRVFDKRFKNPNIERMEMAISPSQPNTIYFAAEDQDDSSLYRSDDWGATWKDAVDLLPSWLGGQGWYDNTIAVNPFDPNNILVAGSGAMLSIIAQNIEGEEKLQVSHTPVTDGYNDFGASSKGVHVDHHNLVLIPENETDGNFIIVNANDGGVAISYNSGETFLQTGDLFQEVDENTGSTRFTTAKSYNTSQFYGVDKMNGADRYVGGTQDNGSWVSGVDPDATSSWVDAPSGDGFEAAWHYGNTDWILESSQFNNVYKSIDGGNEWRQLALPGNGPFFTKLANSKQDPDLVYAVSSEGALISADFGDTWKVTELPDEFGTLASNTAVTVSLASPSVVWYGNSLTDNRRIVVSSDEGQTFTPTSKYALQNKGSLSSIATHPTEPETAYAIFSQSAGAKILKTTDLGQSWNDISGFDGNEVSDRGFPDVAVYSLLVMPHDTNQIWAGTEIGLMESLDGGANWNYSNNGLPPLAIWQMKIVNDEVVLATHARGIWTVALPELANYEPLDVALAPRLNEPKEGFNGNLAGSFKLRSSYDSTRVILTVPVSDDNTIVKSFKIETNIIPIEERYAFQVDLDTDELVEGTIELISYVNGQALRTIGDIIAYDVDDESPQDYINTFDESASDFVFSTLSKKNINGFDNNAIHSSHPYSDRNTEFAILQKPYVVAADKPLEFEEIVIVEPGDTDDIFSEDFFDYVGIDATADNGATWVTIDRYDARANASWVDIYDNETSVPNKDNYITRTIDLTNNFNVGDKIYFRFSLVSDPFVTGWGWSMDNIRWGKNTTSIKDIIPELSEFNLYPNPTSTTAELTYTLLNAAKVSINLYSIDGKFINTLMTPTSLSTGIHTQSLAVDGINNGLYLVELNINNKRRIIKLQKTN